MENPALIYSYVEEILNANLEEFREKFREIMLFETRNTKKEEVKHAINILRHYKTEEYTARLAAQMETRSTKINGFW